MAASVIDYMLGMAQQQGQNLGQSAKNRYTEEQMREIDPRIALMQAQTENFNQQAQNAPLNNELKKMQIMALMSRMNEAQGAKSNFGKVMTDYQNAVKLFGEGSPQATQFKAYIDSLANKNGVQVFDPETGQPLVQIGGSTSGGGRGGNQTYANPKTGDVLSTLTPTMRTQLQKSVTTTPIVVQGMEDIANASSGTVGAWNLLKYGAASVANPVGVGGAETVANYHTAMDRITKNAEHLISINNLPRTNESFHKMIQIMTPHLNDSPKSYRLRIETHMKDEVIKQRMREKLLRETGVWIKNEKSEMPSGTQQERVPEITSGYQGKTQAKAKTTGGNDIEALRNLARSAQ